MGLGKAHLPANFEVAIFVYIRWLKRFIESKHIVLSNIKALHMQRFMNRPICVVRWLAMSEASRDEMSERLWNQQISLHPAEVINSTAIRITWQVRFDHPLSVV